MSPPSGKIEQLLSQPFGVFAELGSDCAKRMNNLILVAVVLVSCTQALPPPFTEECVSGTYPPKDGPQVPTYIVNLDKPPAERWTSLAKEKGPLIKNLLQKLKDLIGAFGSEGKAIINFIDEYMPVLGETLPEPYRDEMKGIAEGANMPLGEVVVFNVFYEIFTVCTSIIAEDPNGQLYHARNLDFGLFMGWNITAHTWIVTEALKPMIGNFEFQKNGTKAYQTVGFVGYIGALTGMKQGKFSVTINERFNADGGYLGILKWLLGSRDIQWMSFLTRNALEKANSYAEAVSMLSNTPMLAPAYYIVGGTKSSEGVVITRARDKSVDVWQMEKAGGWYILETNYDHWKDPLFVDDRRTPANKCMQKMTQQNVGLDRIFDVLNSKPVLNKLTTYTALMQVSSGRLETYIRNCPDPCWPF